MCVANTISQRYVVTFVEILTTLSAVLLATLLAWRRCSTMVYCAIHFTGAAEHIICVCLFRLSGTLPDFPESALRRRIVVNWSRRDREAGLYLSPGR
jgi:hypothetical protein